MTTSKFEFSTKFLSVLLCMVLLISYMPRASLTALADDTQTTLDVSYGDIEIRDDTVSGYDSSGTMIEIRTPDGVSITGSTKEHKVLVMGKPCNIILRGVMIDVSDQYDVCPLNLHNADDCTVTLAEGTINILRAGTDAPGVSVPVGREVTFTGNGELDVTGGRNAPGIGRDTPGNVRIDGGHIKSKGGKDGAGICVSKSVVVNGGVVEAIGDNHEPGIGSYFPYAEGEITLCGGTLKATGGARACAALGFGGESAVGRVTVKPASGYAIRAYNHTGADGPALRGSPFKSETNITSLLFGRHFYSEVGFATYTVDFNLTNCNTSGGGTKASIQADYTAMLTEKPSYQLPDRITVTIGGVAAADTDYTYENGTLKIPKEKIVGDIVITAYGLSTLTVDANDCAVSPSSTLTDAYGYLTELPSPSRENYIFNGWYTAVTGESEVTADTNRFVSGDGVSLTVDGAQVDANKEAGTSNKAIVDAVSGSEHDTASGSQGGTDDDEDGGAETDSDSDEAESQVEEDSIYSSSPEIEYPADEEEGTGTESVKGNQFITGAFVFGLVALSMMVLIIVLWKRRKKES